MTAPERPEDPGTAVVPAKKTMTERMLEAPDAESRILAFETASVLQRAKLIQEAAKEMAGLSWGKDLSEHARHATASWCLQVGIDPLRHIDILGGRIYDNAQLYIDKLASMPEFDHAEVTILAPLSNRTFDVDAFGEKKARELMKEQHETNAERMRLQIAHEVPANINEYPTDAAAALVVLHWKDGTSPTKGVNWAGSRGRTNKYGKGTDPVGDGDPVKTAVTRATRKAAKLKVPVWFKKGEFGAVFDQVEASIEQSRALLKEAGGPEEEIVVPAGSPVFQRAMKLGLESERKKGPIAQISHPEDPYAPEAPAAPAEEVPAADDRGVAEEVEGEGRADQGAVVSTGTPPDGGAVQGDAPSFKCSRCLSWFEAPPTLVEPAEGGTAFYCEPCAQALDVERGPE